MRKGFGGVFRLQYRKYIDRRGVGIAVDDLPDMRLDMYAEPLACLVAGVADVALTDVRFPEAGHVHECHAPRVVAEYEQVAGRFQGGMALQVEPVKTRDDAFIHGTFPRPVDSGINLLKGIGLEGQTLLDGTVADRPQDTHVERHGVADNAPAYEIDIVVGD